ncbi:hypothetical protein FDO65_09960 [Nakamurella flava]|uniref:Uncharacterized protein n=1 Tax=Nakamurella flava TaxID=2576308 RepID=A0A4U6QN19_9ACTN|nr:hypothetical protein [Nakamurella flava]TKV61841.1 hypothetical protein FDO65_09960 [Nakamurella flava]
MSHTQGCMRPALGAAVQHAQLALGTGLFASVPKRTGTVLEDIERLAEKLLAEGKVSCRCEVAVEVWQRDQAAVRRLSAERRRHLTAVAR